MMSDWTSVNVDMPDKAERRRYALLQAAATLVAGAMATDLGVSNDWAEIMDTITLADDILAEIERREKQA